MQSRFPSAGITVMRRRVNWAPSRYSSIYEQVNDNRSYIRNLSSCEKKPENNSGLNGIRTHDLCDTDAVLYQLSYQANWELVIV